MKNELVKQLRDQISKAQGKHLAIEIITRSGVIWKITNPIVIGEVNLLAPVISGKTDRGTVNIDTDSIESIEYILKEASSGAG